jgi:exodeoxyribonuclease V alpha subunit
LIVTPTVKAAQVAGSEVGTVTSSAPRLAYRHGWRWDEPGRWTRLRDGETDPVTGPVHTTPARNELLPSGSLLVVDQAGMLDQDTALALLTLADEHGWRLALLGDRHQLPAVGRGGVLEHAARWIDPITVDVIHRFVRHDDQHGSRMLPDGEYALLSGAMRVGEDPDAVFDALTARDQIRVRAGTAELHTAIADAVLADRQARHETLVVAVTLEQVAALNTTIRGRLVKAGLVDNRHTISTLAGELLGRGDRVATRHNDAGLDVANRETWTVTAVHRDGSLTVRRSQTGL